MSGLAIHITVDLQFVKEYDNFEKLRRSRAK